VTTDTTSLPDGPRGLATRDVTGEVTDAAGGATEISGAGTAATCAGLARANGASLPGTAPVATGWLLVEQPGAWGRKALTASALEPALGASLDEASGDDVRVQLIRRPGRTTAGTTPVRRSVILAHTGPTPWAEQLEVDNDADLYDLDPNVTASPTPPGLGPSVRTPLWLVCTHGRRDRCCATWGRPIVDALAAIHLDAVWEVSHIGGHRFAGNVLSLPTGEVYGGLGVPDALRVVDLHRAGRRDVAHLRGRSGLPRPAQAAEILARQQLGLDAADRLHVTGSDAPTGDGSVTVHLDVDGVAHEAVVVAVPTGLSYPQSCDSDEAEDPGRFELRTLRRP
jgi:hypothetical protein